MLCFIFVTIFQTGEKCYLRIHAIVYYFLHFSLHLRYLLILLVEAFARESCCSCIAGQFLIKIIILTYFTYEQFQVKIGILKFSRALILLVLIKIKCRQALFLSDECMKLSL